MLGERILQILSDGQFHSGTAMGEELGVSRAAVCKAVAMLGRGGLPVHRVPGKGYRVPSPFVPLRESMLRERLAGLERLDLTLLDDTDSTNRYLLERAVPAGRTHVCLAESQRAGRGRRGRAWIATPYSNVLLSIARRFESGPEALAGLSLAAGVAVVDALEEYGIPGAGLKWPNDVLWNERKLAGLLLDVRGEAGGPCNLVLGLGLNLFIAPLEAQQIDQAWIDLHSILPAPADRTHLAALLVSHLVGMLDAFARSGFGDYHARWERRHAHQGRRVQIRGADEQFEGIVEGIDSDGALLVRMRDGGRQRFVSGEVSVRGVS